MKRIISLSLFTFVLVSCVPFDETTQKKIGDSIRCMFSACSVQAAQDAKPESVINKKQETINIPVELDKYKLQAAEAKYLAAKAQIDTLFVQFVANNPQAKQLSETMSTELNEVNKVRAKIFDDAKVNPNEYDIDSATGIITKR